MAKSYYRGANASLLVFDFMDPQTLERLEFWKNQVLQGANSCPSLYVVGTKSDLCKDSRYFFQVHERAAELASIWKAEFWMVSSQSGSNVVNLFNRLVALCFESALLSQLEGLETSTVRSIPSVGASEITLRDRTVKVRTEEDRPVQAEKERSDKNRAETGWSDSDRAKFTTIDLKATPTNFVTQKKQCC